MNHPNSQWYTNCNTVDYSAVYNLDGLFRDGRNDGQRSKLPQPICYLSSNELTLVAFAILWIAF